MCDTVVDEREKKEAIAVSKLLVFLFFSFFLSLDLVPTVYMGYADHCVRSGCCAISVPEVLT